MTELPDRVGGRLALDFVNTVDPRHGPGRREFLTSYADLLDWAEPLGADLPHELSALRRAAATDPGRAQRAFDRAMPPARSALPGLRRRTRAPGRGR